MIVIQILGWISLIIFAITLIICICLKWKDILISIKDFFYGLFTWQKKVPIYRLTGSNQFTELFSLMCPHHYEWRKRETPKVIRNIKTRLGKCLKMELKIGEEYV